MFLRYVAFVMLYKIDDSDQVQILFECFVDMHSVYTDKIEGLSVIKWKFIDKISIQTIKCQLKQFNEEEGKARA